MKTTARELIVAALLAVTLTLLSLVAHAFAPSTLHFSEDQWRDLVEYHQTEGNFRVRPLTTGTVEWAHARIGLSYRSAFLSLQFMLMAITLWVFYLYLRALTLSHRAAMWGMVAFGLSIPVFLAHFEPAGTWDDFWAWTFIPLAWVFALKRRYLPAAIALAAASLSRELSLVFAIPLGHLIYLQDRSRLRALLWPFAAVALFVAARLALSGTDVGPRIWTWGFNFETPLRARDTLFSVFFACGAFWVIGTYRAIRGPSTGLPYMPVYRAGAVILVLTHLAPALLTGLARETRIMFPAALFLIPLTLVYVREHGHILRGWIEHFGKWRSILLGLLIWTASVLTCRSLFPYFEFRRWKDGHWLLAGLHVAALFIFLLLRYTDRRLRRSERRAETS